MEIKTIQFKHCVLVEIEGRIDSATAPRFSEELKKITDEETFHIVLDMSKVQFLSSAGLWVLVNTQKRCKRFNRGEVILASVPEKIQAALDLAGFTPYYKIFNTTAEAVGYF